MRDRAKYWICETLGYALCELAFKTDCRGPFAWAYRAGCWCYHKATDAGIRCGVLVANPHYRSGANQPMYIQK
jgi:hypothetical protein